LIAVGDFPPVVKETIRLKLDQEISRRANEKNSPQWRQK
jgi:hypothetical protein